MSISNDNRLRLWVKGSPIHDYANNLCCPDYSCCHPDLIASPAERDAFMRGTAAQRLRLEILFLNRLIHSAGIDSQLSVHTD